MSPRAPGAFEIADVILIMAELLSEPRIASSLELRTKNALMKLLAALLNRLEEDRRLSPRALQQLRLFKTENADWSTLWVTPNAEWSALWITPGGDDA